MKKMLTVLAIAALTALVSLPVFAQPTPATPIPTDRTIDSLGSLKSNTSLSTSGLFKNDVDNFIDYHKYSTVLADGAKWFGFITGRIDAEVGGVLDAGYARNFGNIYLGVWYRGNIFKANKEFEFSNISPTWDNNREVLLETTETIDYTGYKWQESANQIEFLIGVAGHGIKVGFFESYVSDQNGGNRPSTIIDYQDGRKDYKDATASYENSYGYLKPYLGWGTSFSVSGMNLMPYVDLGLHIYGDKLIDNYQDYTEVNRVKQNIVGTVGDGHNNGFLEPYGVIGAKLDLVPKNNVQTQLGLSYGIAMCLYDNSFSATGLSGSAGGEVSWGTGTNTVTDSFTDITTNTDITLNINEKSIIGHEIIPTYKITSDVDANFKFGFSMSVPVTIITGSNLGYEDQYQITKVDNKADKSLNTETTTKIRTYDGDAHSELSAFNIALKMNLGASYKLIPDRFTVNAGISAVPVSYTHIVVKIKPNHVDTVTTTETKDALGNKTETKSITDASGTNNEDTFGIDDIWDQWEASLFGGFVFNFNSRAALDMGVNAGRGSGNGFNLDLTTVNVIFTIKY
jgi:hypothetical protein